MMNRVKGFLIDLDGVMYTGDRPIPGAKEAIEFILAENYAVRFVSNTTRKSRKAIAERMEKMGLEIPREYIFTPALAAVTYMKKTGKQNCFLLVTGDAERDFGTFGRFSPETRADFVVIGDAGERITYDSMTTAFRHLMDGADLIALEKDRYWMAGDGLSLSAGPFVAALEYATGKNATIVGKPSRDFFSLALNDMGLGPEEVVMIGDDIRTDIEGSQRAGMQGILVRTGKFREEVLKNPPVRPSCVIDSIADLQYLLPDELGRKSVKGS